MPIARSDEDVVSAFALNEAEALSFENHFTVPSATVVPPCKTTTVHAADQ